eukprot:gene10050-11079_t
MGGETRGRRRDRSSSLEYEKKKPKKSRKYRKKTYSESSASSDDDRRSSPEKKKSKVKAKKKHKDSPSPDKRKKKRRSRSRSLSESSLERKPLKKKKSRKFSDSGEDSHTKSKKKKHRYDSRSKSRSPKPKKKEKRKAPDEKRQKKDLSDVDDGKGVEEGSDDERRRREKKKPRDSKRDKDAHMERHSRKMRGEENNGVSHHGKEENSERDDRKDREDKGDMVNRKAKDDVRDREGHKNRDELDRDERRRGRDMDRERELERDKRERDRNRDARYRDDRARDKERDRDRERNREKARADERSDRAIKNRKEESEKEAASFGDIEDEMRRRKERVEAWRTARQRKEGDAKMSKDGEEESGGKKWTLEDEDDDDDDLEGGQQDAEMKEEEEELDPLDAYMKEVNKEVKKISSFGDVSTGKGKKATIVTTVVKRVFETKESKPEVMEQNQDLMEYSSEEKEDEDILEGAAFAAVKQKKKKELLAADHSKIYYRQFRKNFYVEVPELARMTEAEVDAYRVELDGIRIVGKNVPKPIRTWAQSGVHNKTLDVLKKCSYEKPTPVQAQGIPAIMSGRDVIGIAKTGSGKTLAFLLPMFRHILDQDPLDEGDGPVAIIMTPTRELALQINKECRKFCKPLGLHSVCIYGGSGISEQIAELKRGAEIIVCTPGRMIDMLTANNGRVTNCRRCTYFVLDEADRMFDMGFEPQVMKIIANVRDDRQTVMFSATFPRLMEALARKLLKSPVEIEVGGRSIVCSDIAQHVVVIDEDNKFLKLLELLGMNQDNGSTLVFVEKQDSADRLFKDLLKRGYPCLSLHGGMDQFDRDSTIADFKNRVVTVMVATSVAARGLDVKHLNLVVNYDCPNHYEDYVHRVGRTGRAGNKGTAFTMVTPEQGKYAQDILKALEASKTMPPDNLSALWKEYKEQMKAEGKKVVRDKNKGFGGKGFKFDDEEEARTNEAKKMQKWALGLQDSDDEAEAAENAMDKIEEDLNKAFVDSKPKKAPPELAPGLVGQPVVAIDKDKMKVASSIAAKLNMKISQGQNTDRTQQAASQILKGGALEKIKGIGLAKQLADKVNAKLNYKAPEPEKDEEAAQEPEKLEKYEAEIDVNDFPQQARWRITSKETLSRVCELSEAGITVRGSFVPSGSKLKEGEKKLHLYIESLSERAIQIARAEVRRLLKEELIKYESANYRPQASGRYKVV